MNKNLEKYINNCPYVDKFNKIIFQYIIKNKKYEFLDNSKFKEIFDQLCDYDSSLLLLNNTDNNADASKYLLNKIRNNFNKNDEEIFIDFILKTIKNVYSFDTILKIISKKKDSNFC
jgi:hypothetical protein